MTRKTLTVAAAALMLAAGLAPGLAVASDPNDDPYKPSRQQFVMDINWPEPTRGSYSKTYQCRGDDCWVTITLGSGGWVEYDFDLPYMVDKAHLWVHGFGSSNSQPCTYQIKSSVLGNDYGTVREACPGSESWNHRRGTWYGIFFDGMFDSYTLRIECVDSCSRVGIEGLKFEGYFREIEMKPLEVTTTKRSVDGMVDGLQNGEYVSDTCVRVQVAASPMYGVDYFRIDWGDGDTTYAEVPLTWGKSFWDETFCHSYALTLGEYYLTVFAHDRLDRTVKRHAYTTWNWME